MLTKRNIIWILVLFLITINISSSVSAENSYLFERSTTSQLRSTCLNTNDTLCGASTNCFLTVIAPNSTTIINNGTMTNNVTFYNYSLTPSQTSQTGEHSAIVVCDGGTNAFTTFTYLVTPNGKEPSTALGILYIGLFAVMVLLFVMGVTSIFKFENVYAKFTMLQVSYLLFIVVIFLTYNIANNFLTGAPFLIDWAFIVFRIFMVGYLPFVIMSIIWLIFEIRKIEVIKKLMEKGVPEDEATARIIKRGKAKW